MPRGLETVVVARLLAACDRTTVVGRRDYAILIVLARLGLCGAEVADLQLGDIRRTGCVWKSSIPTRGSVRRRRRSRTRYTQIPRPPTGHRHPTRAEPLGQRPLGVFW